MASYVVAASFFLLGTSYLVQFVIEPPGSSTGGLDHANLKSRGAQALDVLLGTPGVPRTWSATAAEIDAVDRLGLLEPGTSVRVNASKFDALARGSWLTASSTNGAIDYAEAKAALGLDNYEFHLRAYPILSPAAGDQYGVEGLENFRVAYVGDVSGEAYATSAMYEASALENLSITFLNRTRTTNVIGDVFQDDSNTIRTHLLPNLGATIQQEIISSGSGTKYDFFRVDKTSYQGLVPLNTSASLSNAMAISSDGATLGYTKNREIRAIVGSANLSAASGSSLAKIHWYEWVDTDRGNLSYDCGDYGYVEVSADLGATWIKLSDTTTDRSQDCSPLGVHPASMVEGFPIVGTEITSTNCAACAGNHNVLVAFHWIADNDNNIGYGWVVDNVKVVLPSGAVALSKTFETPAYDLLIVGSGVDHGAFTPSEVKDGIRDYVNKHGGRLMVLGGQSNVNWLDRLLDAAGPGSGGAVTAPDPTHPVLTVPNLLQYTGYSAATPWDLSDTSEAATFSRVAGPADSAHHLSVSRQGAWGGGSATEGAVILTSYQPHQFNEEEARRFFANVLVFQRFHYLNLEVGPPVPSHGSVASVARTGLMNKYRDGTVEYTEIAFVIYVWPGSSVAGTQGTSAINPLAVTAFSANARSAQIWVNWTEPTSFGTGGDLAYEVWRSNGPTNMSLVKTIQKAAFNGTSGTFHDHNVTNGLSYWYNVTVWSNTGRGTSANPVMATPLALPSAPLTPQAAPATGAISVSWSAPSSAGGGNIYGYAVWVNDSVGGYVLAGETGSVTAYSHTVSDTVARTFKISALNGAGWGPNSTVTSATSAISPATPPTLSVTNALPNRLDLAWLAPDNLGGAALSGYRIYRSATGAAESWYELAYSNSPVNLTWIDANVTANTTYHYRMRAVTTGGEGLNSTDKSSSTMGTPWHPTGLTRTGGTLGVIIMTWNVPSSNGGSPITKYEIFRGNPAGTEVKIGESVVAGYTDATAGIGSTWYYKVRAVNVVGAGTFSSTVMMNG